MPVRGMAPLPHTRCRSYLQRGTPLAICLAVAVLSFPAGTLAADAAPDGASADEAPSEGEATRAKLMEISCRDSEDHPDSWLDRSHSYVSQRLCEPAAWFDGFFGDDRTLEETPVGTFFRVRNELRWDQEEGVDNRLRLSANISLPGASENLRLLLTRDEDLNGEFAPYLPTEETNGQTRVGVRYKLSERMRSRFDIDATFQPDWGSLNPVLRGRYRHVEQLTDQTFVRFTQIAYWEGEEGFGTTSRGDFEWYRTYDTQLRYSAQGTWSEESDGVDWRSGVTAFRQLDEKTAIRTELGAFGWTDPEFEAEEYFLNFRYRRSFFRPWLFYELQPEHAWVIDEDSENRRGDWRFIVTLEVQFENEPSRDDRERRRIKRWFNWLNRQIEGRDSPQAEDSTSDQSPESVDGQGRMNM